MPAIAIARQFTKGSFARDVVRIYSWLLDYSNRHRLHSTSITFCIRYFNDFICSVCNSVPDSVFRFRCLWQSLVNSWVCLLWLFDQQLVELVLLKNIKFTAPWPLKRIDLNEKMHLPTDFLEFPSIFLFSCVSGVFAFPEVAFSLRSGPVCYMACVLRLRYSWMVCLVNFHQLSHTFPYGRYFICPYSLPTFPPSEALTSDGFLYFFFIYTSSFHGSVSNAWLSSFIRNNVIHCLLMSYVT